MPNPHLGVYIGNRARTELYDFCNYVEYFMAISNFGMGLLHVKRQIITYFSAYMASTIFGTGFYTSKIDVK